MDSQTKQIQELFEQFLDVCNKAMEAHREDFPYKHIWEAAEKLQGNKGLHVTIYDDEPKGDYQLRIENKRIACVEEGAQADAAHGWRMNTSYLRHVVEHPQEYISQPAKLDWKWLKNRSGF